MSYDNLLNKLVLIYESQILELDDPQKSIAPPATDTVEIGPESVINVRAVHDETDPQVIADALQSGNFYAVYVNVDGKTKRYVKSKRLPNGIEFKNGNLVTNKGNVIDPSQVQKLQVSEIITDRDFIQHSFGADNIVQYRIGYTVPDTDPRKIRVSNKKMISFVLDRAHMKLNPETKKIMISKETPLKNANYKPDPSIFDQIVGQTQSLDRSRDELEKDRLQIKNKLIDDEKIKQAGINVSDNKAVSKFIRENGFTIIPEELLKLSNKNNLKEYLNKNPIIKRYIQRMKEAIDKFISPTARGETKPEGIDRVEANEFLKQLGDDIFVVVDDEVLN
jgi:hypothetical protein